MIQDQFKYVNPRDLIHGNKIYGLADALQLTQGYEIESNGTFGRYEYVCFTNGIMLFCYGGMDWDGEIYVRFFLVTEERVKQIQIENKPR